MRRFPLTALAALAALGLSAAPLSAQETGHAAWDSRPDGPAWTAAAQTAVEPLLDLTPTDAAVFCPGYASLSADQRRGFWVDFLSGLAVAESSLKPGLSTWRLRDADVHRPTFRRGLLQISIESARRPDYGCDAAGPDDLLKAGPNLACGARILSVLIKTDSVIAGDGGKGGARYWPTLADRKARTLLATETGALPACRASAP